MNYSIALDVLETTISSTVVRPKHVALLTMLASKADMPNITHLTSRDGYWDMPHRILDRDGKEIAPNYRNWCEEQFEARNGNALRVWEDFKDAGYLLTKCKNLLHIFTHDRGDEQTNFVQLKIFEKQEFVDCELFDATARHYEKPENLRDLQDIRCTGPSVEIKFIGNPWYDIQEGFDMKLLMVEATRVNEAIREQTRRRAIAVSQSGSDDKIHTTFGDFFPEAFPYAWGGARWFKDWEESSAGRSGARACDHWYFDINDWQRTPNSERSIGFIPQWGFKRKMAEVNKAGSNPVELLTKLQKIDDRTGVPFHWYFYMLHGNRVHSWAGEFIVKAVENGLIELPESDYRVLKRYEEQPYGF